MFLVHFENDTIFIAYQDQSSEGKLVGPSLISKLNASKIPKAIYNRINDLFINNSVISESFDRQKNYVNSVSTYIDAIHEENGSKVYFLNLYILPKDITLKYDSTQADEEFIRKIERLSFRIYQLYTTQLNQNNVYLKILNEFKGETFLDFQMQFYKKELQRLHDHLINYTRSLKDQIICSDKHVGVMINDLNNLEGNPLKRYQFVKVPHQNDLIIFVYSLLCFLQTYKLDFFKEHTSFKELVSIVEKINSFLKKISTSPFLKKEQVTIKTISHFFQTYRNSSEIKKNRIVLEILEGIFFNQLKEGVFLAKSIDMTKMFEQVVEKRLRIQYGRDLFIGDENHGKIQGIKPYSDELNQINFLLNKGHRKIIKQFPDFIIKDGTVNNIVDAKYKLHHKALERETIWQVLIYAKLFNNSKDMKSIKKVVVYAQKSDVDLDDFSDLNINIDQGINIHSAVETYQENVFDSDISFLGIKTLQMF